MSGHSKWAQIKHKKAATDAKRGNLFAKLARAITIAAKDGEDPAMNSRLRLAIEKARGFNLPADNIERAILRATSAKENDELASVMYEAYAPGGSAILIEGITDNKNRMAAEIKHVLTESNGKFAETGSVGWMFQKKGVIFLPKAQNPRLDGDEMELLLIDAGAEDIGEYDEGIVIYTVPEKRAMVEERLRKEGLAIGNSSDCYIPKTPVTLQEGPEKERLRKLAAELELHDDVLNVWSNVEKL